MSAPLESKSSSLETNTPPIITPRKQNLSNSLDSEKTLDVAKQSLEGPSKQTKEEISPHKGSLSDSLPVTLVPTKEATDQKGKDLLPKENHLPNPLSIPPPIKQGIQSGMIDFSQASDEQITAFLNANFDLVDASMEKDDLFSMVKQAQVVLLCETHTEKEHCEKNGALIDVLAAQAKGRNEIIVLGEGTKVILGEEQLKFIRTPHIPVASWDNISGAVIEALRHLTNITQTGQLLIKEVFNKPSFTKKDVTDQCDAAIKWLNTTPKYCTFDRNHVSKTVAMIEAIKNAATTETINPIKARSLLIQEISLLMIHSSGKVFKKYHATAIADHPERQSVLVTSIQIYKEQYPFIAVIGGAAHLDPNSAAKGMDKTQITDVYKKLKENEISYITLSPRNGPIEIPPQVQDPVTSVSDTSNLFQLQDTSKPVSKPQAVQPTITQPVALPPSVPQTFSEAQKQYASLMKEILQLRNDIVAVSKESLLASDVAVQTTQQFLALLQREHRLAILEEFYPKLAPEPPSSEAKPSSFIDDCTIS